MVITRQQFLRFAAAAGAGAAAGLLLACGGEDDEGIAAGACAATISANHGHTFRIEAADIDAGTEKTYDIHGDSDHGHAITLTAADFDTLASGGSVTVTSTSGGEHTHEVAISDCA